MMIQKRYSRNSILMFAVVALSLLVGVTSSLFAKEEVAQKQISYYEQIRPIFQARCHGCHQPVRRLKV